MRIIFTAFLLCVLCAYGSAASAQACTASATPVAFGSYNTFSGTATDTTATVTVNCNALVSLLVSYTVKLNGGTGGVIGTRRMSNGVSSLFYQLYTNGGRTTVWGDGTGGSQFVLDGYLLQVATPVIRNYTVYGRISALQNVTYGSYTDTVTILLSY